MIAVSCFRMSMELSLQVGPDAKEVERESPDNSFRREGTGRPADSLSFRDNAATIGNSVARTVRSVGLQRDTRKTVAVSIARRKSERVPFFPAGAHPRPLRF